jgi:hypothetical protein
MRYRTTAARMKELYVALADRVEPESLARALRLEDLEIVLTCDDHGELIPLAPKCMHPDHGPSGERLQRIVVNHDALDEIEQSTTDDAIRQLITRSRDRLE